MSILLALTFWKIDGKDCAQFKSENMDSQFFYSKEVGFELLDYFANHYAFDEHELTGLMDAIESSKLQKKLTQDDTNASLKEIEKIKTASILKNKGILNNIPINENTVVN